MIDAALMQLSGRIAALERQLEQQNTTDIPIANDGHVDIGSGHYGPLGTADDSATIQAALDAAQELFLDGTMNPAIHFPRGHFYAKNLWTHSQSGNVRDITFQGEGAGYAGTIIELSEADGQLFDLGPNSAGFTGGVHFRKLQLYGHSATNTGTVIGFKNVLTSGGRVTIEDCRLEYGDYGLYLPEYSDVVRLMRNTFSKFTKGSVYVYQPDAILISGNSFEWLSLLAAPLDPDLANVTLIYPMGAAIEGNLFAGATYGTTGGQSWALEIRGAGGQDTGQHVGQPGALAIMGNHVEEDGWLHLVNQVPQLTHTGNFILAHRGVWIDDVAAANAGNANYAASDHHWDLSHNTWVWADVGATGGAPDDKEVALRAAYINDTDYYDLKVGQSTSLGLANRKLLSTEWRGNQFLYSGSGVENDGRWTRDEKVISTGGATGAPQLNRAFWLARYGADNLQTRNPHANPIRPNGVGVTVYPGKMAFGTRRWPQYDGANHNNGPATEVAGLTGWGNLQYARGISQDAKPISHVGGTETLGNGVTTKTVTFASPFAGVTFWGAGQSQASETYSGAAIAIGTYTVVLRPLLRFDSATLAGVETRYVRLPGASFNCTIAAATNQGIAMTLASQFPELITVDAWDDAVISASSVGGMANRAIPFVASNFVYDKFSDVLHWIGTASHYGDTNVTIDRSHEEVYTDYKVIVTPSWLTTIRVTGKVAGGFVVDFGTATPDANQKIDWFIFR